MNSLLKQASDSVEGGWLLGVMTLVFLAIFIWWVWYAYAPSHKARLDEAALMPLDEGGDL